MTGSPEPVDDLFTARELARAAGVSEADVLDLIARGQVATRGDGPFIARAEAIRAGRWILDRRAADATTRAPLFSSASASPAPARAPFAASGIAHAALALVLVAATTLGLGRTTMLADEGTGRSAARLVFLALPGPGGGGGGGGARQAPAPPKAERTGTHALSSPLPPREAPRPKATARTKDQDPPEPLAPVEAPVVTAPADARTHAGVLDDTLARNESRGPGAGGGAGTGEGAGLGEGDGDGIGDGSGGGTGGGAYGPGSGVEPPSLLREVKPDYTEPARRDGIEGDVLMEIVVRRDGSVRDVRIVRALGHGLDERAVQAVRRWRFTPGHRKGTPVDVRVEVAIEFRIR